jgi:hypothetical protein
MLAVEESDIDTLMNQQFATNIINTSAGTIFAGPLDVT